MSTDIQIFNHAEFGEVRINDNNGTMWFVAADICRSLGLSNPTVALESLDADEKAKLNLGLRGGDTNVVNESGLYALVLKSRKPDARKFRKWLTSEVIPSIRKTGLYINPNAPIDPNFLRRMADELEAKDKQIAALTEEKAKLKPKADYCESILQSKGGVPITIIAKDYGQSAAAFNQLLAKYKIQYRCGNAWVIKEPYSKLGYTESETLILKNGLAVVHTKWTQKGRMHLYNELKRHGILPTCERDNPMAVLL